MRINSSADISKSRWWLAAYAAVLLLSFFKLPHFPIDDSATFEYYGNAMLHGQKLYLDLWDNKLPSIYFVNAAFQLVMPHLYALHQFFQLTLNVFSAYLFRSILTRREAKYTEIAALIFFTIISLIPRHLNTSEHYALPLILLSFIFFERGKGFVSAICIAFACTFWVPSAIPAAWFLFRLPTRSKLAFFSGSALIAGLLVAILTLLTNGNIGGLLASWHGYLQSDSGVHSLKTFIGRLHDSLGDAMITPLILALFVWFRKPTNRFEVDLLGWTLCSFVAACVSLRLYAHYFLPLTAPLLLLIACAASSFELGDLKRQPWRGAIALVAALMLIRSGLAARHIFKTVHGYDLEQRSIGTQINSAGASGMTLETVGRYAPEIFLSSGLRPTSSTGIVASAVASASQEGVYDFPKTGAQIVLLYQHSTLNNIPQSYIEVQSFAREWHIYAQKSVSKKLQSIKRSIKQIYL
jgi:hypothetical protein